MEERPDVPLIPAVITITPEVPSAGSWTVHVQFHRAEVSRGRVEQIQPGSPICESEIHFVGWSDAIPDVYDVIQGDFGRDGYMPLTIDEELLETRIQIWQLTNDVLQIRYETEGHKEDVSADLLVDAVNFREEWHKAWMFFASHGGWFGDFSEEKESREETLPDDEDIRIVNSLKLA